MIINKEGIYNFILSFKKDKNKNLDEMAGLLGMKSRQGFDSMMKKRTLTLDQLAAFIENTGSDPFKVLSISKTNNTTDSLKDCEQCAVKEQLIESLQYTIELQKQMLQKEGAVANKPKGGLEDEKKIG